MVRLSQGSRTCVPIFILQQERYISIAAFKIDPTLSDRIEGKYEPCMTSFFRKITLRCTSDISSSFEAHRLHMAVPHARRHLWRARGMSTEEPNNKNRQATVYLVYRQYRSSVRVRFTIETRELSAVYPQSKM